MSYLISLEIFTNSCFINITATRFYKQWENLNMFPKGTPITTSSVFTYVPHAHVFYMENILTNIPHGNIHSHILFGHRSLEASLGNLFASTFLQKIKILHTSHRNSEYYASQEIQPGPPENCDVRGLKLSKLSTRKNRADSSRDKGRWIIHRRSPSFAQGRKALWKKIWDVVNSTKLKRLVKDLEASDLPLILHAKNTGSWLTVQGTTVTGTVLVSTEFRYFFAHVMMLPPPPPQP